MEFILEQSQIREDYKVKSKTSPVIVVWRKKPTKGLLTLFIFAVVVPVLVYFFVFDKGTFPVEEPNTCSVGTTYRITCGRTDINATYAYCTNIKCCFDNSTRLCYHYLPSKYYYYNKGNFETYERSLEKSPFGQDLTKEISLTINEIDENSVQIILHDFNVTVDSNTVPDKNYKVNISKDPLYVEIARKNSEDILLTTADGPLIVSENFREWSFQLTDQYLFGLGQVLIDLDENSTLTKVIYANNNDHNTLPVFMAYKNGLYHGLVVRHSGLLEITVLPSKLVSLKSLEREKIILELSVGPTPHDVITQQKKGKWGTIDMKTLGVHICREGSASTLKDILSDYTQEKSIDFPYESDCFHDNLLMALRKEKSEQNINTVLEKIKGFTDNGHSFMLSVSPHILFGSALYDNGTELGIFYKSDNKTYKGQYLKNTVVFPYFKHNSIDLFMQILVEELKGYFKDMFPSDFVLKSNWPRDDSFEFDDYENFRFFSQEIIDAMSYTLPWDVYSGSQLQMLDHNDYGALQIQKFLSVLSNSSLMTASHNFETTHPLIIQNVAISWVNFKKAISQILYNSIAGNPMTSIPICGSTGNFDVSTHEALCTRWYLMGTTAPIFRISSDMPRRDPTSLGSGAFGQAARRAIEIRYSLLYYYYTVLNQDKEPLMRPMFYDFTSDNDTFSLIDQYMVGKHLLVAHPTLPDRTQITLYLPKSVNVWYEFWGGEAYGSSRNKSWITLTLVDTDLVAFVREGGIIPWTTDDNETKIVQLKVALKCDNNNNCDAEGAMMVGLGLLTFQSTEKKLTVVKSGDIGSDKKFILNEIILFQSGSSTRYFDFTEGKNLNEISDTWTYIYDENLI
ncbi:lysosomal alpha-glucosidase-like [Tribolium madens]|uniref:lysosomal alpha-glucosidase-like n=1 Tax=Tribolium madens TaxID=41895 RepID=UPI001CF7285F|nr:lysosomal alpha-glucosidase-like [Tribolium madens]